jgi:hypothetical protein
VKLKGSTGYQKRGHAEVEAKVTQKGKVQGEVHVSWASHCLWAQLSQTSNIKGHILSSYKVIAVHKAAEGSLH